MRRILLLIALVVVVCVSVSAQVTPPKPIKSVGTLPTTCYYALVGRVDEIYKTGASAGFYTCNSSGTSWDGPYASSGGVTSITGTANQIVVTGTTTPTLSIPSTLVAPGTITATTSTASPFFVSTNADPADAGAIRLGNAELIEWESSPASTDVTLTVNSSEQFVFSAPVSALTIGAGSSITSSGAGGALGALSFITPGTGIATALAVNIGSAGAPVLFNGALGTPSSGTLTSTTGLPISTGLTGAGTGVLTALGVNVGSAGAFVVNGGALGTPSSGTLSSATGLPVSTGISGLGTGVATALAVANNSAGGYSPIDGTAELTNKTLNASVGKGTWTASGTWTLPAFTLGGTVSGGGNQLNNIVIGTTTPLAGSFTTLAASGAITQTSNSATAFESGPNGGTNPVFRLVNSTASAITGLSITGNATGNGVLLSALGGTNETINLTPKGSGKVTVNSSLAVIAGGNTFVFSPAAGSWLRVLNSSETVWLGVSTAKLGVSGVLSFGTNGGETASTGISEISAGLIGIGTGAASSTAGSLSFTALTASGATQTLSNAAFTTCAGLSTTANVIGCVVSDRRLKQDFTSFNRGLDAIARLSPHTYQFRPETQYFGKGEYHTGLVAQDVQAVIPEAVSDTGNGTLQIDQATMTATLVNGMNQLRARVEKLEKENARLRRRRY